MKKLWPILAILVLSWFSVRPLFQPGLFSIHDDTQVARVFEMSRALKEGQWPVRLVADLGYGYGYPLFNFYAPLPYYFAAFFSLIGVNLLTATKLMFLAGILLAPVLMYFLAKEFWGKTAGILAALFYLYAPYHALDIYVRGAVGEFWAIAFLPLVFLVFARIGREEEKSWLRVLFGGFTYALLLLSHNLAALTATPFLLAWILFWAFRAKDFRSAIQASLTALFFGLLVSAFYWLPAIREIGFIDAERLVVGEGGDFNHHFLFLDQLWDWPWGFAGSGPGRADGMSFKIGKLHLVVALLSLAGALFKREKKKIDTGMAVFLAGAALVSVFFTLGISRFLWRALPLFPFLQYPWRFLILIVFFVSWLTGSLFSGMKRFAPLILTALVLGLIGYHARYFQPQEFYSPDRDYTSFKALAWEASRRSDEYLPPGFRIPQSFEELPQEKIVFEEGEGEIEDVVIKSSSYSFQIWSRRPARVKINALSFPGFKAWVDGQETVLEARGDQLIEVKLSPGEHQVSVELTNTPIRAVANWLSLIGFGILGGGVIKYQHGKKPERKGRT